MVPHAALTYSGPVAAHGYLRLADACPPEVIVIIGPDHHGAGGAISLAPEARWRTPLGEVITEHPVKAALRRHGLAENRGGHAQEHCIEVQLPFLQYLGYEGPVLPVVMGAQDPETVRRLVDGLGEAAGSHELTLIASTDLSHYLPHDRATQTDRFVLDALLTGDGLALLEVVARRQITMCGPGPAAAVLETIRRLGGGRVEVLRYATSGDVSGDRSSVVGYVAAAIEAA
jgi:AmmeMemoRadiSam system protein B